MEQEEQKNKNSDNDLVASCLAGFGRISLKTADGVRYCGSIIPIKFPCSYRQDEMVEIPQDSSGKIPAHLRSPEIHYKCFYGQKVVMVVDNDVLFYFMERTLIPRGYTVLTTTTSEQALSDLSRFHKERRRFNDAVHVILSGHGISPDNGIELLRKVSEQYPSVTRVLQTSYKGRAEYAVNSGVAHLKLIKPATIQDLADTVDKAYEMCMQAQQKKE